MKPLTAAALADQLVAQHVAWFREHPTQELIQTIMLEQENGEVHFIPCPWRDALEREYVLAALRTLMAARKAVRYAVWAEVWTKSVTPPAGVTTVEDAQRYANDTYRHGDLAEDPDHDEAVFTLVVEPGRKLTTRMQRIERGRAGGVRRLVLVEGGDDMGDMGGALADLMPEQSVH